MKFLLTGPSKKFLKVIKSSLLEVKEEVWKSFSSEWKLENIDQNIKNISLDELPTEIEKILKGKQIGRVRVVYD